MHQARSTSLFISWTTLFKAVRPVWMIVVSEGTTAPLKPNVARVVLTFRKFQNILCGSCLVQCHRRTTSSIISWQVCPTHVLRVIRILHVLSGRLKDECFRWFVKVVSHWFCTALLYSWGMCERHIKERNGQTWCSRGFVVVSTTAGSYIENTGGGVQLAVVVQALACLQSSEPSLFCGSAWTQKQVVSLSSVHWKDKRGLLA